MKYENKRNGKMFEKVTEVDPKYKTLIIRDLETGEEKCTSVSTFRRWYKKVEEDVPAEDTTTEEAPEVVVPAELEEIPVEEIPVKEPEEEVEETVNTEPEEVVTEQNPVEEAPKTKKERSKREMRPDIKALHEYVLQTCVELGGNIFTPAKDIKFRGLKVGEHNFIKYNWSNRTVTLFVRAQALGLEEPITPVNHTFNDKYMFDKDTPENRAEIFRIMKTAYDWQVCKNLAKQDKAKKNKTTESEADD